jgi:hypothetical protein
MMLAGSLFDRSKQTKPKASGRGGRTRREPRETRRPPDQRRRGLALGQSIESFRVIRVPLR